MSLAINTKECMFFVGGNDYKSNNPAGSSVAGGCTKAWWDSYLNGKKPGDSGYEAACQNAMYMLMKSDGSPRFSVSTYIIESVDNSGCVRLSGSNGDFYDSFDDVAAEPGMLLYHPNTENILDGGGDGVIEIIDVDTSNYSWVDINVSYNSINSNNADTVHVGGGWNDLDTLATSYIGASSYSQYVYQNKNLTGTEKPSSQWVWANWGGGSKTNNTFLVVEGFNRVPGDIVSPKGNYHQTIADARKNGIDPDCWVNIDMDSMHASIAVDTKGSQNIIFAGFHCYATGTINPSKHSAGTMSHNLIFHHNIVHSVDGSAFGLNATTHLLAFDNWFKASSYNCWSLNYIDGLFAANNIIEAQDGSQACAIGYSTGAFVFNLLSGDYAPFAPLPDGNFLAYGNTMIDGETFGGIRTGGNASTTFCHISSLNNIILTTAQNIAAYEMLDHLSYGYGSIFANNDCCYADGVGALTNLIKAPKVTGTGFLGDNILQVDPQLDSDRLPRNKEVLFGGSNVCGQKTTIGAASQEHQFTGRSTKSNPGRIGIIR